MNPLIKKAQEEYLAAFGGDKRAAYMLVRSDDPRFLEYKRKCAAILEVGGKT